jgi:hypothetical protein
MATIKSVKGVHTIVLEATSVSRHVAIAETAGGITVPGPDGLSDHHIHPIELPGVIETPSAIFYRTRRTGKPTFSVRINNAPLTQYTFIDNDPLERTWHEIIPASTPAGPTLRSENNEMVLGVRGDGTVTFGDVVILYTSNELTIKVPIVLLP